VETVSGNVVSHSFS